MTVNPEEAWRLVLQHTGRHDLPRPVAQAIRTITRASPRDPAAWLVAARCLRHTKHTWWAFTCYRRARRLNPGDLALAEETGMFGVRSLGNGNARRSALFHLVAARADPERRARVDPILHWYARPFPAGLATIVALGSLFGMLVGSSVVRRGDGVVGEPADGLVPQTAAGIAVARVTVFAVVGLFWALIRPVGQFSREILRRVFWPPRIVHALAMVAALASVPLAVLVVSRVGYTDALDSTGTFVAISVVSTIGLTLLGLPRGMSIQAVLDLVKEMATGNK